MKALVFESYSKIPRVKNVPIPQPKEGEVLVKVAYCGVNRIDLGILAGRFGNSLPFPLIMGSEIVGTLPNGRRVAVNPYLHCGKCKYCNKKEYLACELGRPLIGAQKNGGYAEYVTVPKDNIVSIPDGLPFQDATAVTVSGGTAYRMVFTKANIEPKSWVLVIAAGSGVGVYSTQFAKLTGTRVLAAAGSNEKLKKIEKLGITYTINYSRANWINKLANITKNQGIDTVIDTVGGSILEKVLSVVNPLGKVVLCGATENPKITVNLINLYVKQLQIIGSSGFMNEDLVKIFQLVKTKKIKPVIDSIFSLEDLSKAWQKLRSRDVFGKILIKIE